MRIIESLLREYIFFFQAEDGIRDSSVTGVQTCALPISYGTTSANRYPAARRRTVRPDDRLLIAGAVQFAIYREPGDGNLQHNGVHIETSYRVRSIVVGVVAVYLRSQHATDSHAEMQRIERRSHITEKRSIHRTRKYSRPIAQLKNPQVEMRLLIRHGVGPNVRRDRIQRPSTGQVCGLAVLDHGDGVGLAQTEAFRSRSVESGDRRNAGQVSYEPREQSGQADLRIESELKSDVFYSVLVVVNLHFIENVGIERKIVGTV